MLIKTYTTAKANTILISVFPVRLPTNAITIAITLNLHLMSSSVLKDIFESIENYKSTVLNYLSKCQYNNPRIQ